MSRIFNTKAQYRDSTGNPVSGGSLTFYLNRSTNKAPIFSDAELTIPQTNSYELDASGRVNSDIWFGVTVTVQVKDSSGAQVDLIDDVNPSSIILSSGVTYIHSGTGAVETNLKAITDNFQIDVSAMFSAVKDGIVDSSATLLNANNAGLEKYVPPGTYRVSSNLTLTGKWIFADGAKLKADTGVETTINGEIVAGNYEIFDGTALGTIAGTFLNRIVNILWFGPVGDGITNDGPNVNKAYAAIGADRNVFTGGVMYAPGGLDFHSDEEIVVPNHIKTIGDGMPGPASVGASIPDGSQSRFSGGTALSTRLFDCRNSVNIGFENIAIIATGSFSGHLLDYSGPTSDTRGGYVDNCLIGGGKDNTSVSSASCIHLNKANQMSITRTSFRSIQESAIHGKSEGPSSYTNSVLIQRCSFEKVGNIARGAIRSPGQGWVMQNNNFQETRTGNVYALQGGNCQGMVFTGNTVYNDTENDVTGSVITLTSVSGGIISGNHLGCSNIGISISEASGETAESLIIEGNDFGLPNNAAADKIAIDFGTGATVKSKNIIIGTNTYSPNFTTEIRRNSGQTESYIIQGNASLTQPLWEIGADTTSLAPITAINNLRSGSTNEKLVSYRRNDVETGSVTGSASSTSFNVSCDHRIKNTFGDYDRELAMGIINSLLVHDAEFKAEVGYRQPLFLAHELQAVIAHAVWGEKDAVDAKGEMILQQLDQSKIINYIVPAMQYLFDELQALKNP